MQRVAGQRVNLQDVLIVPVLAVVVALAIGGIVMFATGVPPDAMLRSYAALFRGSLGSLYALSETLTAAIPLTLAALGLALGFKAGLFNIGAEGQLIMGGLAAVVVGFSLPELPSFLHLPLALLAGALGGAAWAAIAGWLRAATGAHEVILTIMLNLTAARLLTYLLRNPPLQNPERSDPISRSVVETAQLPQLLDWIDPGLRLHAGLLLALGAVALVYWLLYRTTIGFEFRASGANADAARYAGMRAGFVIVAAMALSGALAGLAGANQVLGVLGRVSPNFSSGIGFDAIAVALLGRSHPAGVLIAGLLFGALQAGGRQMQVSAGVSLDLISVVQALVIIFIAAPVLIRLVFPWAFPARSHG
ncbi:MAG TPA: ABC transporter permease [Alphaproteobacteria bacterium]|nr:ABC transporter permease [Alphaproteobacteria bacterium]